MKKLFLATLCVGFVVVSFSGSALALSYYTSAGDGDAATMYTGEYMFTVTDPGNDNIWTWANNDVDDLIGEMNLWFGSDYVTGLELYNKVPDNETPGNEVDFEGGNAKVGTWATADGTSVEFYTVKAAKEWALYWIDGGASSGDWSTEHVATRKGNIPTISHLSLWNPSSNTVVPEPSTVFLLGIGLLGVLGLGRKIKK